MKVLVIVASAFCVGLLFTLMSGSVAKTQTSTTGASLNMFQDTDSTFSGIFVRQNSEIKFSAIRGEQNSRSTSPSVAPNIEVSVVFGISGKRVEAHKNLATGQTSFDGNANRLSSTDKQSLSMLSNRFDNMFVPTLNSSRYSKDSMLEPQEELLHATATFLTEAPIGLPLPQVKSAMPNKASKVFDSNRNLLLSNTTNPSSFSTHINLDHTCSAEEPKSFLLAARACRRADQDYRAGTTTVPRYFLCTTRKRHNEHDTSFHCMKGRFNNSGPRAAYCTGRCGKGCGNQNGYGVYTQDCLDHDICVGFHGYSAPGCQDEFKETWDDASWGTTSYGRSRSCRR